MANKFGRYKPEEEKAVRKVEVVEDETLKQLKAAWKAFAYENDSQKAYENALTLVEPLKYSASDVKKFSIALAEFQNEDEFTDKTGLFLSALINKGDDSDYVVHTAHLPVPLHSIGHRNTKNITVKGDVGGLCGWLMQSGSIIVEGNAGFQCGLDMADGSITVLGDAGNALGSIKGGRILVEGDAGNICGFGMKRGLITVKGDVGSECGRNMKGGRIAVNGDCGKECGCWMRRGSIRVNGGMLDISEHIHHGRIYHRGELIIKK
jgi:hypothetical protein